MLASCFTCLLAIFILEKVERERESFIKLYLTVVGQKKRFLWGTGAVGVYTLHKLEIIVEYNTNESIVKFIGRLCVFDFFAEIRAI